MGVGMLLVCVLVVGVCTYVVDYVNHKRAQKEGGYISVFPAIRNALVATLVGAALMYVATPADQAASLQSLPYMDETGDFVRQMVVADRVPRHPAHVDA